MFSFGFYSWVPQMNFRDSVHSFLYFPALLFKRIYHGTSPQGNMIKLCKKNQTNPHQKRKQTKKNNHPTNKPKKQKPKAKLHKRFLQQNTNQFNIYQLVSSILFSVYLKDSAIKQYTWEQFPLVTSEHLEPNVRMNVWLGVI